jgi:endonuclease YncB( thermonuclease family)
VVDGDTIKVEVSGDVYTVRYIGIDTHEIVHPEKPVEWMGPEASAANKQLVDGQTVYLEKDVSETDQYGRLLCYVYLEDGTCVNAELVRLDYAQVSTYPPDVRYQELFLEMQEEAREAESGLWGSTPTPVPPTATPRPTLPPPAPTLAPTQPPPTPAPTQLPPTEPPAPAPAAVQITYIYYDGQVKRVESDKYAVVRNNGGSAVNLGGWRLNAGAPGQDFWFPGVELQPGQECRVYTNESHPESCGFSFGSGQALWNNKGDCGHLYDADGAEVSTYCY